MEWRISDLVLPAIVAIGGTALIGLWISSRPPQRIDPRLPGQDQTETMAMGGVVEPPPVAGTPQAGDGQPATIEGTWPWFRGREHDGISHDKTPLARRWPESGPPVLWTVTLGEGYASPVIADGCAYVLDYDEQTQSDTMRCLSLDDGREVWHNSYPVELTRNHGISRTVPAVADGLILSIGPRCHVACWDARTGECNWLIDMVGQFGTEVPRWYTGQCPLVDGDSLILAPCGKSLMVAVDWKTGEIRWKTPNPKGWDMTHASIMPMRFQDRKMYVYCASGAVVGVDAEDGKLLWESTQWTTQFATAPSPVILSEGRVFLSSGYGSKVGSLMLKLDVVAGGLRAEPLFSLTPRQFNSEQQTPIFHDGHLFGVRKHGGGQLVCLDLKGNEVWNSGADRFGHGPYMIADGVVLAMSNDGLLVMAQASTKKYQRLARFQVFEDGHDAWGPMALASGRLIVRDMTRMSCLDLTASSAPLNNP